MRSEPSATPLTPPAPAVGGLAVHYVTMAFPTPSETFTSYDVRLLMEQGAAVTVHALRPEPAAAKALVIERGLDRARLTHTSSASLGQGFREGLRRPQRAAALLAFVLRRLWRRPGQLLRSLAVAPRVLEIVADIERSRPDVVHLYWAHYPSLVGFLVQRELPEVVTSISFSAYDMHIRYGGSAPVAARAGLVRTLAAVNLDTLERAFGVPRERVEVIYDGVDLGALDARARPKVPRRIVTAGRLIKDKGVAEVLSVFARLRDRWPDTTLVVLGDGPERGALERLAVRLGVSEAVSFLGHVSHDRVLDEMAAAEVFLFLSISERLPNVVKEAIGCRCLCVVAETPGLDELLDPETHGFITRQGDLEAPLRILDEAFAGRIDVAARLDAAERHLREHFGRDRAVARYLERWRALRELRRHAPHEGRRSRSPARS